jgi:putative hemolysin
MALQSAGLLCSQLLAGPDKERLADTDWHASVARCYAQQWRRQFAPRMLLGAAMAHMAMRPAASGLLMALTRGWPALLTQGARWGGKVRCAADPALFGRARSAS